MAAPCSSTSSAPCRARPRTGCCARSNMARSPGSARPSRSRSTSASSPRPTRICPAQVEQGRFRADLLDRLWFEVDHPAAAALAPGRHPGARRAFRPAHGGRARMAQLARLQPARDGRARSLSLARQRPRIAQRRRARGLSAEDPERPIDEIQFDPFHSPWAPATGERRPRAAPQSADDRRAQPLAPAAAAAAGRDQRLSRRGLRL